MKKKFTVIVIALIVGMLAACGMTDNQNGAEQTEIPEPLEVELTVPEKADVKEEVEFKGLVTQGEEKVTDADEVVFEVWKEGKKDNSEMIESRNLGDGSYVAKKTFDHDGVYTVQIHVTARDMHSMPKKMITVGDGAAEKTTEHHGDDSDEGHEDHDHH